LNELYKDLIFVCEFEIKDGRQGKRSLYSKTSWKIFWKL